MKTFERLFQDENNPNKWHRFTAHKNGLVTYNQLVNNKPFYEEEELHHSNGHAHLWYSWLEENKIVWSISEFIKECRQFNYMTIQKDYGLVARGRSGEYSELLTLIDDMAGYVQLPANNEA